MSNVREFPRPKVVSAARTLRDDFAIAAMQQLIGQHGLHLSAVETAEMAYTYAEAMMLTREAE